MRILLLGGTGMLCHELFQSWKERFDVTVTLREGPEKYSASKLFSTGNIKYNVTVENDAGLNALIHEVRPDWVVNCIGIVKQRADAKEAIPSIELNSLFPHRLAMHCKSAGANVIQMSTDCIFSGKKGNYSEEDVPDPLDMYGKSKWLGEIAYPNSITLRTSIIGLELGRAQGLIEWFLAARGEARGYRRAIYSGFTTMEMARILERVFLNHALLGKVWHVASKPINKFELLTLLSKMLGRTDLQLVPSDTFICDRSLCGKLFEEAAQYRAPEWPQMLDELAQRIKLRNT